MTSGSVHNYKDFLWACIITDLCYIALLFTSVLQTDFNGLGYAFLAFLLMLPMAGLLVLGAVLTAKCRSRNQSPRNVLIGSAINFVVFLGPYIFAGIIYVFKHPTKIRAELSDTFRISLSDVSQTRQNNELIDVAVATFLFINSKVKQSIAKTKKDTLEPDTAQPGPRSERDVSSGKGKYLVN